MKSLQKAIGLGAIVLALTGCGGAESTNNATARSMQTKYADIEFMYPEDWKAMDGDEARNLTGVRDAIAVFVSPPDYEGDKFRENLSATMQRVSESVKLEDYVNDYIKDIKYAGRKARMFGAEASILESQSTSLGGIPAHRIVISGKSNGQELKFLQVIAFYRNNAYTITFTAEASKFSEYLQTVNKMLDNIKFRAKD